MEFFDGHKRKGILALFQGHWPVYESTEYGKIINFASDTLFKGIPFVLHYISSKGPLGEMMRTILREVGDDSICVDTIAFWSTMSDGVFAKEEFLIHETQP